MCGFGLRTRCLGGSGRLGRISTERTEGGAPLSRPASQARCRKRSQSGRGSPGSSPARERVTIRGRRVRMGVRDVGLFTLAPKEDMLAWPMRSLTMLVVVAISACRAERGAPPSEPSQAVEGTDFPYEVDYSRPHTESGAVTRERRERTSDERHEMDFPSSGWSSSPAPEASVGECCRVCRTGKACGNTCIAAGRACQKPRGCACDG